MSFHFLLDYFWAESAIGGVVVIYDSINKKTDHIIRQSQVIKYIQEKNNCRKVTYALQSKSLNFKTEA